MDIRSVFSNSLPSRDWDVASRASHAWVALAHARDWQPWLADGLALIDSVEASRMQRRYKADDRVVLTLAYSLHRLLLGQLLDMDPEAVPMWRDASGCPRVGEGLISTSLSHSDGWIALAACNEGPVGVDVETFSRLGMLPGMVDSICHPAEKLALQHLAADACKRALLALWVRKEALLKAAGTGLAREMNTFEAPLGELPLEPGSPRSSCLRMVDGGPECVLALASPVGLELSFSRLVPLMA